MLLILYLVTKTFHNHFKINYSVFIFVISTNIPTGGNYHSKLIKIFLNQFIEVIVNVV